MKADNAQDRAENPHLPKLEFYDSTASGQMDAVKPVYTKTDDSAPHGGATAKDQSGPGNQVNQAQDVHRGDQVNNMAFPFANNFGNQIPGGGTSSGDAHHDAAGHHNNGGQRAGDHATAPPPVSTKPPAPSPLPPAA